MATFDAGERCMVLIYKMLMLAAYPVNPQVPGSSPGRGAIIHGHFRRKARFILGPNSGFVPKKFQHPGF